MGTRRAVVCFVVVMVGCALLAGRAAAATFSVDSTADAVDAAPGNGVCATAGNGPVTLRDAIVQNNTAGAAGGIFENGGGALTIIDSTISHNTASGPGASGGGIRSAYVPVTIRGSMISDNVAHNTSFAFA